MNVVNENIFMYLWTQNQHALSPLLLAISKGHAEIVEVGQREMAVFALPPVSLGFHSTITMGDAHIHTGHVDKCMYIHFVVG